MTDIAVSVTPPDEGQLKKDTLAFRALAFELDVQTQEAFEDAADELKAVKTKAKELDTKRKGITKPLDQAKKAVMDLFREPLQFLSDAERVLKQKMLAYNQEQDRIRREQQAKAEALARKEREKLERRAEKARERGREEMADALEAQADATPVIKPPEAPKVAGVSTRVTWEAVVVDRIALIKAVAEGKVPDSVLSVDMKVLNQMARALKGELRYPGVKTQPKQTMSARS